MGRVFQYQEIKEGRVPTPADFEEGRKEIWRCLENCPDVVGAIVCGSLLHGTYNRRSDIDVVLYYNDTPAAQSVITHLRRFGAQRSLEINLLPVDTIIAKTRFHTLGWGFLQHLSVSISEGGLIKLNFLPLLKQDHLDPYADTAEYISFKMRYLGKSIDEFTHIDPGNPKHTDMMQKGLELPVHIARKHLALAGVDMQEESKPTVVRLYREHMGPELADQLDRLVAADIAYTQLLEQQLVRPDAREYRRRLNQIATILPLSKQFARTNALLIEEASQGHQLTQAAVSTIDRLPSVALPLVS